MKLSASLSLLAATALAAPGLCAPKPQKSFRLQTAGASNAAHNGLWVRTYHTGAGYNDAVLSTDGAGAPHVSLNATNALFDLKTEFPWGMQVGVDTNYASWEPVEINTGTGTSGFSLNETGFVWSYEQGFGGWLVCDWFHNVPQLFWLSRYYEAVIPCSCSKVQLKPVYDA